MSLTRDEARRGDQQWFFVYLVLALAMTAETVWLALRRDGFAYMTGATAVALTLSLAAAAVRWRRACRG